MLRWPSRSATSLMGRRWLTSCGGQAVAHQMRAGDRGSAISTRFSAIARSCEMMLLSSIGRTGGHGVKIHAGCRSWAWHGAHNRRALRPIPVASGTTRSRFALVRRTITSALRHRISWSSSDLSSLLRKPVVAARSRMARFAYAHRRRHVDRIDGVPDVLPRQPRRQVGQPIAGRTRDKPGKILIVESDQCRNRRNMRGMRRVRGSRVIVGRQRQKVLDDGKHMLARHRGKRLPGSWHVVPRENRRASRSNPSQVLGSSHGPAAGDPDR